MKNFSKTPPKGSGTEFRFIQTFSICGGETEPAAIKYGMDGKPESVILLGRGGEFDPSWVAEWGPLASAQGDDFIGSLQEAKQQVLAGREGKKGVKCPCCGKPVARRNRALNAGMAKFLCQLVLKFRASDKWVDVKTINVRGGDYAKLQYWGLIENKPNTDSAKRTSGLWKPTQKGLAFVDCKFSVPSHAIVTDGVLTGFSKSMVYIIDVPKFNYHELMRS